MTQFSPAFFRQQFPAIEQTGIYLDSAATALKPKVLLDATQRYYGQSGATVHRSLHAEALATTELFEQARSQAAQFINAADAGQLVWTKGTTEAINLIAQSYAVPRLQAGDEILVCETEHHANLIPWLMAAERTGARVIKLPMAENYLPDLALLEKTLTTKTKILAIGQMSNVTGGCPDLAYAVRLAHQNQTIVVVDGAQGIVHHPADVQKLDIDFYAFSAHKLYGPTGVGVLYGKSALLEQMSPWQGGGKMLTHASFSGFNPQTAPGRFEAGTPNIAGVIGFGAVLNWLTQFDMIEAERYSRQLAVRAHSRLASLPGFISYQAGESSLLAFNFVNCHHSDIAAILTGQGIAVRSGQHCAQPIIDAFGVSGTVRASFAPYNTFDEVDIFCQGVERALSILTE
jgi:cysteine sulfinate desulfinase